MTKSEFLMFMRYGAGVCLLIALLSLLRFKRVGRHARYLTAAILAMSMLMLSASLEAPDGLLIAIGVLVLLLLLTDASSRRSGRKDA